MIIPSIKFIHSSKSFDGQRMILKRSACLENICLPYYNNESVNGRSCFNV